MNYNRSNSLFRILYVGCGPVLRLFSTDTGEHIQDLEFSTITCDKPEGSIVDICLHPFEKNNIVICFEEGRIITWSFETNSVISNFVSTVHFFLFSISPSKVPL